MKHKSMPAFVKARRDADENPGEFQAIVSVFGNADSWGDVVMPGAFAKSLAEWKASGDQIPVLWSHRMDDPQYNIGSIIEAEELAAGDPRIPDWADPHVKDHGGLWVRGLIDTGPDASPIAKAGLNLLRKRRVTQFSFAYDVADEAVNANGHNELRELKLFEVSPTQVGMNQLTELVGVKARCTCGAAAVTTTEAKSDEEAAASAEDRRSAATLRTLCDIAAAEYEITQVS